VITIGAFLSSGYPPDLLPRVFVPFCTTTTLVPAVGAMNRKMLDEHLMYVCDPPAGHRQVQSSIAQGGRKTAHFEYAPLAASGMD
jgi:hypothetical protein